MENTTLLGPGIRLVDHEAAPSGESVHDKWDNGRPAHINKMIGWGSHGDSGLRSSYQIIISIYYKIIYPLEGISLEIIGSGYLHYYVSYNYFSVMTMILRVM